MENISNTICRITGADSLVLGEKIQSLWSGYGVIRRAQLHFNGGGKGRARSKVVVKHIDISSARTNPRGWLSETSHQRKVRSYQVEKKFYECFSQDCDEKCQVPELVAAHQLENASGWLIILQDLDSLGFGIRKSNVNQRDIVTCLKWLANFHATFLGRSADGLWPVGTYWHLGTRPDEFSAMPSGTLKQYAKVIDQRLNSANFQTLIHGDAKIANFCFSEKVPDQVAAVDFQYVGRGCGMKDVAYLISSCLSDREASERQDELLDFYFQQLDFALVTRAVKLDFSKIEHEWRGLYPFAWADFCRFLSGWSPGHWKLNQYSDQITAAALNQIK